MILIYMIILIALASQDVISASLTDKMAGKPEISKFYEMFKTFQDKFPEKFLTVFAPLNDAYDYSKLINDDDKLVFIKKHVTEWVNKPGLIENWKEKYLKGVVHSWSKFCDNFYCTLLLFYKRNNVPYVNTAIIDEANVLQHENRVCYIIKSHLAAIHRTGNFIEYINTEPKVQTYKKYLLNIINKSPGIPSGYYSEIPTLLIPTDDSFAALPAQINNRLKSDPQLQTRMMYSLTVHSKTPGLFLNEDFDFDVKVPNREDYAGKYVKSKGMIKLGNKTANLIEKNIIVRDAVLHLVDKVVFDFTDIKYLLSNNYSKYYSMLVQSADLKIDWNDQSLTFLIPESKFLDELSKTDNKTKINMLGLFILRDFNLTATSLLSKTITNQTYLYSGSFISFVDEDKKVRRVLKLGSRNADLFSGNRVFNSESNILNVDNTKAIACKDVWPIIGLSSYAKALSKLDISVGKGSPYTLFAPSDDIMKQEVMTLKTEFQKYVLKRLILPINRSLDSFVVNEKYRVPTMNYARNKEHIIVTKSSDGQLKVENGPVVGTIDRFNYPYSCYAEDAYKTDRSRDLTIYPVNFSLTTKSDKDSTTDLSCKTIYCKKSGSQITNSIILSIVCIALSFILK